MRLPLSWLREFVEVPVEPGRLGDDLTLAGFALDGLESDGKDALLDIDVTTNRVDCMNVYGLAREIAVLYGVPLRPLALNLGEKGAPASEVLDVGIEAPDLCPRFSARVLDVRLGPSPAWIRDRLEAVGVRPIHNVVDLTNYVMMEMGHPSHAFDLARIPQGRLRVRWARDGEGLETLDGVSRRLSRRQGVVAGLEEALALAGVMGGASSEVSEETTVVALEAAYWEPLAIRRAARALGMHTEASHRFERGADPEATVIALARIAHLLEKIGAGSARPGVVDRVAVPRRKRTIPLRPARVRAVLGVDVPQPKAEAILSGLGFRVEADEGKVMSVEVPSWRGDVGREADLIEEVGRHFGLDKIPSSIPPTDARGGLGVGQAEERTLRATLVAAGLTEAITYAFVGESTAGTGGATVGGTAVALENPLADGQSVLRSSLVLPGLLEALDANERQGRRDVALFEVGRVFHPGPGLPIEERRLGILLAGCFGARHWSEKPRAADFFDLSGLLERLFERLGQGPLVLGREAERPDFLHPGQSGAILLEGKVLGYLGAIRPGFREGREDLFVAELGLDPLLGKPAPRVRFQALPRFPAVDRDLSVLVDAAAGAEEVCAGIRRAAGPLLVAVTVVDRYDRPPVPAGRVSLTVSLRYQDPERTLTSDEVQASVEAVIRQLRAAGLEIRGE
jgi:phenylalanyl-tRNA synthetase beta chain